MLKTGDADVAANIPSVLVDELQSDPNVEIEMVPGYRTIYLGLNFQDVEACKSEGPRGNRLCH